MTMVGVAQRVVQRRRNSFETKNHYDAPQHVVADETWHRFSYSPTRGAFSPFSIAPSYRRRAGIVGHTYATKMEPLTGFGTAGWLFTHRLQKSPPTFIEKCLFLPNQTKPLTRKFKIQRTKFKRIAAS